MTGTRTRQKRQSSPTCRCCVHTLAVLHTDSTSGVDSHKHGFERCSTLIICGTSLLSRLPRARRTVSRQAPTDSLSCLLSTPTFNQEPCLSCSNSFCRFECGSETDASTGHRRSPCLTRLPPTDQKSMNTSKSPWRFVTFHHPPYTTAKHDTPGTSASVCMCVLANLTVIDLHCLQAHG